MSMLAEIRLPLVLSVPNQNHRSTDAQNQLMHCSLVGSHKFKPKSQYNAHLSCYPAALYSNEHVGREIIYSHFKVSKVNKVAIFTESYKFHLYVVPFDVYVHYIDNAFM